MMGDRVPPRAGAPRVVVLTGAGVSAESGLATFRDAGGLWEGHRPEDVATPEAWEHDAAQVWRFYQLRRAALATVRPNAAHDALATFEERLVGAGHGFLLVTQNVDDLHERAGSRRLLHMHGELLRLRCDACGEEREDRERLDPDRLLACETCGAGRLRPAVVWFGEIPLHLDAIEEELLGCTHFLAVGTSGVVYPAAGFLSVARRMGAATWVQALEPPENTHPRDTFVAGPAAEVLPGLLEGLLAGWGL